ncbi:myb-like protein I [Dioscorea cayenensis subsp. rotundata]|uniref:Myb-like protein I n=1 Tax=Dioscorea cayennensis subsp. rotundata TaxID=55577 RepID=A0AB40CQX2_DIOCR|nr:myb-like protein I [Dioscorea cayenensis subsp. rotundata]
MEIEIESPGDPSCSTDTMEKKKKKKQQHNPNTKEKNSLEQQNGEHLGTREHYANPNCKHASNPYHSCGPYCSPSNNSHPTQSRVTNMNEVLANQRRKEIAKGKAIKAEPGGVNGVKQVIVDKKIANPNCKNASNPYHVCAEYCLSKASNQGQTKGVTVGSKQPSKYLNIKGGNSNPNSNSNSNINFSGNSKCKNASNPYHKCAEYCFNTPNHDQQPKKEIEKMKKRNGHSSSVDAFNPPKNQVKAIESNTKEGDEKLMDNDNKRNSWSFYEEDLIERVSILNGSEHDLEASYERDLHLQEIDSFDFHSQKISKAEENKKTEEVKMEVLQQMKINAPNSYSNSVPNLLKKLPKSDNQYKNRKAISSPCSPFHFGLLLISVLYYIAHVIITGAVFPEGKTYARIKYKESEDIKREGIDTSSF